MQAFFADTFFLQEHITKLCPDKKRTITDPNTGDIVQLQFRMGSLRSLHEQFLMRHEGTDCSLSTFQRNVPFNICKPKENEWGTCLCIYCVNPQLKLDRLTHLKLIPHVMDLETIDYEIIPDLISEIEEHKMD